jgi:hypothetical protein
MWKDSLIQLPAQYRPFQRLCSTFYNFLRVSETVRIKGRVIINIFILGLHVFQTFKKIYSHFCGLNYIHYADKITLYLISGTLFIIFILIVLNFLVLLFVLVFLFI